MRGKMKYQVAIILKPCFTIGQLTCVSLQCTFVLKELGTAQLE